MSETEYPDVPERRSFVDAISAVAGQRRPLSGKQVIALVVGAVMTYFAIQGVRHTIQAPAPEPKPKYDASADSAGRPFTPPPSPLMPGVTNAVFQPPGAPPMPATNQVGPIYDQLNGNGNGKRDKTPEELARESDIGMGGTSASQVSGSPLPRQTDPNAPAGAQTDLARSLQPTEVAASVAHVIPHPDFTVSEGALIPCINLTPLSSGQAVFVSAEIPVDVWSMTHKVRLIDAGATITGEIRMANAVAPGQDRIPVLWRNITTKGDHPIRIAVNSPAGDELGLGGLQGTVISHWLRRVGGALLYSGIQSGTQLGTAALLGGRNGGSNIYSLGNGVGQDVAAEALRENANIPDEIKRDQGLSCSVLLGRDLDFSNVYGLRPVSGGSRPLAVRASRP